MNTREFICCDCNESSTKQLWDATTAEGYNCDIDDICKIFEDDYEDSTFICPNCGKVVVGEALVEIL